MPFKKFTCLVSEDGKGRRKAPVEEEELQVVPVPLPEIPDEEKGICVVNLQKKDGVGLGITVSGGVDKGNLPRVSNLRSTGIAAKSDVLQVGDFITAVNGIRTSKMKHGEIISLLKNIGEKVALEVEYRLPPITVKTSTIIQKTYEVKLLKVDEAFGFIVRGGYHEQHNKSRPYVITHVRPDTPAARTGIVVSGDRILSINGNTLANITCEDLNKELKAIGPEETCFVMEYDISVMEAVSNASGPLLVEISKTPAAELGITLVITTHRKKTVFCVEKITPGSISDRCGALHVGDQVFSIDGVSLDPINMTLNDASLMLKSTSDQVRLEILPVSHLAIEAPKNVTSNRYAATISSAQSLSALNSRRFGTMSNASSYRNNNRWKKNYNRSNKYSASAISLTSMDYLSGNQVVHTEQLTVTLLAANDMSPQSSQFGINLQGGIFATEVLTSPPTIAFLEPDSSSERSGMIQSGDRLISVNGCMCEDSTLDEINQLLSDAMNIGQVVLEMEFDIGESVVPSSGTFHVKLPKKRGVELGIVVNSSYQAGEQVLYISDILRGTIAHRSGSLQEGDRLLAIDGIRLNGASIQDAMSLIENAEDVVKLKIKKDTDNSDDDSGSISYSVELKRYGEPLGITITGTDDPFDPITISGLNPGGLAARTRAIHEGDQILSINNVSLRAKPLNDAIKLLRSAGETVTLKIKKAAIPDASNSRWSRPKHQRVHSATMPRHHVMREPITEQSDPEDDSLPPPMPNFSQSHFTPVSQFPKTTDAFSSVQDGVKIAATNSVDSATGSWDSEVKSNELSGNVSDSTLSQSTLSPTTSPETKYQTGGRREKKSNSIDVLRANMRTRQLSDWQNALDDLQSVGQAADVVRDLEQSIMSTNKLHLNDSAYNTPPNRQYQPQYSSHGEGLHNPSSHFSPYMNTPRSRPQLHELTLLKSSNEDFGFSVSDGQLERGVFIHTTKPGGPADRAGIRPFDRVLQINKTRTRDFDCCQAIPLMASSGERIELVIARDPFTSLSSHTPLLTPPVNVPLPTSDNDSLHAL